MDAIPKLEDKYPRNSRRNGPSCVDLRDGVLVGKIHVASVSFESRARRINPRLLFDTIGRNRHRDVLGSRKLPVERDGRFPTTKICSHTNPPLPSSPPATLARSQPACSPLSPPVAVVSSSDAALVVLLISTYLSFSPYTRDTRTCAPTRRRV